MPDVVATNCRCCPATCGILVEVAGDRVSRVSGDKAHPMSQGYLCPKGHSLPEFHHRSDRLNHPLVTGSRTTWTALLDNLARTIAALTEQYGPDSIGLYTGTGMAADLLGKAALTQLMTRLGSTQIYSPITVDIAPAFKVAEMITGTARLLPMWVPEDPDSSFILWIGGNPLVSHGYMQRMADPVRRIRAFQSRGGEFWLADPRTTRSARLAERHLPILPGTDALLLGWLVREILDNGQVSNAFLESATPDQIKEFSGHLRKLTEAHVVERTGLTGSDLRDLLASVMRAGRISIAIGTGVTFDRNALITDWLRWVLLLMTDSLDRPGGMWFHPGWLDPLDVEGQVIPALTPPAPGPKSRPDLVRVFGEIPCAAMADEIESGTLRALIVGGASPLTAFPDPARTRAALGSLDVLAVADVVSTPLTDMATHVLPVTGHLERTDLQQNRLPRAMISPAVVRPVAERKPVWWIAAKLARRLGFDPLYGLDPDATTELDLLRHLSLGARSDFEDLVSAGPHGVDVPLPVGWVQGHLHEHRWNIVPQCLLDRLARLEIPPPAASKFSFISGRQVDRVNGTDYVPRQKSREGGLLHMSPSDAQELTITDGSLVKVESAHGAMIVNVRVDASIGQGLVYAPHGWYEANVGQLTSASEEIDGLAGQPTMSSIPVSITRIDEGDGASLY